MNRSKIEWCDYTWNPITGCWHSCEYCYARKMTARFAGDVRLNMMAKEDYYTQESKDGSGPVFILDKPMLNETGHVLAYPFGFEPTIHRYRLNTLDKLKMGNNIFVGAMADMFGAWVPDEWIRGVMEACEENIMHNYLFLTKNPQRYTEYGVRTGLENFWYGTTITREVEMSKFNLLPAGCKIFVSMEPILEDLAPEQHNLLFRQVDWIILGAETGSKKGKTVPELDWVKKIVVQADKAEIPVFMKDSLIPIVGEADMRREFPSELQKKIISKKMEKKLYGNCASCKTNKRKSNMIALLARAKRGEMPKQLGFLCKDCFEILCKQLELDMPDFERGKSNDL
ncbi:phage Gp37/Gp68 family protein [Clostridiales Family XIII bacterium ASD5510]|uniref:Phage Gp37/Gp68 family protein n=1 Tax=Hominibacterium faecale TaxID=2839743 RepID=A0A9J6QYA2_9FIRM|nr:DUF5131 family protein [Hominibacterium faecale]MCU7380486.1 phage Gp37/Gp68 family protein [Hominibacterium faecale]